MTRIAPGTQGKEKGCKEKRICKERSTRATSSGPASGVGSAHPQSQRPLTPDPCPRAKIAQPSDSYTRRPGIPHHAPGLHSAAQPAAAAANIPTAETLQPPPPPHRCHSSSCASPRIRRLLSLSPDRPAPRPNATAHWPRERPE